jgi:hypothetical protein
MFNGPNPTPTTAKVVGGWWLKSMTNVRFAGLPKMSEITVSWKTTENSEETAKDVQTKREETITLDDREAERLLQKLATGVKCSSNAVKAQLRDRAEKIEVEKTHYKTLDADFKTADD